jgi:hypothetical protein
MSEFSGRKQDRMFENRALRGIFEPNKEEV